LDTVGADTVPTVGASFTSVTAMLKDSALLEPSELVAWTVTVWLGAVSKSSALLTVTTPLASIAKRPPASLVSV
jgi:hypothetical protein